MVEKRVLVVDGVLFRGKKILLGKRPLSKNAFPGLWELPGGHVEEGETPENALEREFLEELGIKVHVLREIHSFPYFSAGIKKKVLVFLVSQVGSEPLKALDHDELRWVSEEELAGLPVTVEERQAVMVGFKNLPD